MELKPIRTKKEYKAALAETEQLWDPPEETIEADKMIRRLTDRLGLPADVLIRPYELHKAAA